MSVEFKKEMRELVMTSILEPDPSLSPSPTLTRGLDRA